MALTPSQRATIRRLLSENPSLGVRDLAELLGARDQLHDIAGFLFRESLDKPPQQETQRKTALESNGERCD